MALAPGTRIGPYEVVASLGAGGMGEVYRARDTKLKREVALKILPESLSSDPERVARFQREAEVLASLNHPHIAAIYGIEDSPGRRALVMELVEGPTLADVIERRAGLSGPAGEPGPKGPGLPVDDALSIARQIVEALEAAHEHGVIHRDFKPANIKIRPDGMVKVLDFGLAKLAGPPEGGHYARDDRGVRPDLTASPTITSPAMMTGVGALLGTAAYMSPEQAKGRPADKRSDVWAFGCVLYEMLSGTRTFAGDDVTDTLAFVLTKEPDWAALPPSTPASIKRLLRRCLEKDRKRRLADIADARLEIDEAVTAPVVQPPSATPSATVTPSLRARRRAVTLAAVAAIALAVGGATAWLTMRSPLAPPSVTRLTITPPSAAGLTINGTDRDLAITPDGSRVVYVGANGTQLFVRALDALEPVAIFKGAPRGPFVSPDGQWVGFVDNNTLLKKVAITGGPSLTIASTDASTPRGATWSEDDTIVFATVNATTGLQRVPAGGGPPSVLTRPDRAQGEQDHLWPEMLPGGRAVLFTIVAQTGGLDAAQVGLLDLQTGTRKVLLRGGSHAHYVPGGYLVYAAGGTLRVIGFDPERLDVSGTPVPVVPEVAMTAQGGVDAVVAANGTLAYVSGGSGAARRLVWVNRQGQETPIPAPPRMYVYQRLAPDNSSVMLYLQDQELDIWHWSLARATLTRVTFDPGIDAYPVWTPDGRRLIFSSERSGARNLFWQAADGTGAVERLTESPNPQNALSVSPDGMHVLFLEAAPKTSDDIMQVSLDGTRRVTPVIQTPFSERNAVVSPDSRWIAYEANNSGQSEVYVRPFPDVNGGQWQVSTGGGTRPLWSRSGQVLFYVAPLGAILVVGVERSQSWAATAPMMVLKEGYLTNLGGNPGRTYDISPDGQRFLMIKAGGASDPAAPPPSLIVVQNWDQELKRLLPTR